MTPLESASARQREKLRTEHSRKLATLLSQREDLRGVHPLADMVSDGLLWTA